MPFSAWVMLVLMLGMFVVLFATRIPARRGLSRRADDLPHVPSGARAGLLAGFSNPGVLTVGVLFVVAAGMYSTGAVNRVSTS